MTADTDWIVPGARVAVVYGHGNSVCFATVERLTATQIVLDNGDKYRRNRLDRIGDSIWGPHMLRNPADPWVVLRVAGQRKQNAISRVIEAAGALRREDVDALPALLDAVDAAVATARKAVAAYQAVHAQNGDKS